MFPVEGASDWDAVEQPSVSARIIIAEPCKLQPLCRGNRDAKLRTLGACFDFLRHPRSGRPALKPGDCRGDAGRTIFPGSHSRNGSRGGPDPQEIRRFLTLAYRGTCASGRRAPGSGETGGSMRHGRTAGVSDAWPARLVARSGRHNSPVQRSSLRQHSRRCTKCSASGPSASRKCSARPCDGPSLGARAVSRRGGHRRTRPGRCRATRLVGARIDFGSTDAPAVRCGSDPEPSPPRALVRVRVRVRMQRGPAFEILHRDQSMTRFRGQAHFLPHPGR